jgi:excinuclease UvrABC ATPase subunit
VWLRALPLTGSAREVGAHVMEELAARVEFLLDVGLGYLTLDRQTRTLSAARRSGSPFQRPGRPAGGCDVRAR